MTKRQMMAALTALAPDFQMRAERPGHDLVLVVRFTHRGVGHILTRPVGAEGRAAVETRLLSDALARLHPASRLDCGAS